MTQKTVVLLTNLGTPDDLSKKSVRRFLREFLSDGRVVEIPSLIWWFILNMLILPFRAGKSLKAYKSIWTDQGSPLLQISKQQQQSLQKKLGSNTNVALAMRYGNPSLGVALKSVMKESVEKLIVLPLYPQNSATTTATTFDHLAQTLRPYRNLPEIHFINGYFANPGYINSLAGSVSEHWKQQGRQRFLLMSFHGLPQNFVEKGDPYYDQCMTTGDLLATILGLSSEQWRLSFQSRFGKAKWIKPYTSEVLINMAQNGLKEIDVICPGFSADCLETLEEICIENQAFFLQNGGEQYFYIKALNNREEHIQMMEDLVKPYLSS